MKIKLSKFFWLLCCLILSLNGAICTEIAISRGKKNVEEIKQDYLWQAQQKTNHKRLTTMKWIYENGPTVTSKRALEIYDEANKIQAKTSSFGSF